MCLDPAYCHLQLYSHFGLVGSKEKILLFALREINNQLFLELDRFYELMACRAGTMINLPIILMTHIIFTLSFVL